MAKTQRTAEVSEDEADYEVEAIRKHKRESGKLHYFVSWVGYPSSEPGNDTWIPEEDAAGADEIINAYWKSLPASKQAQRYAAAAPGSKGKSAAKSTPATSVSMSAKRSASKAVEDDSDDEEIKSASKSNGAKKSKKNDADGAANKAAASKKAASAKKDKLAAVAKVKAVKVEAKAARRAPSSGDEEDNENEEEEEEEDAEDEEEEEVTPDAADGYNVEGRTCKHHENDYKEIMDWEPLVKAIDTVERTPENVLKLFVIWQEDDSYSWVESDMARLRCPQKVIDFYEGHLKFKVKDDEDV